MTASVSRKRPLLTTFQGTHRLALSRGLGEKRLQSQVTQQMPSGFLQISTKAGDTYPGLQTVVVKVRTH